MKIYDTKVNLESREYYIQVLKKVDLTPEVPRLVIPTYLPTKETVDIVKVAIQSIFKFTDTLFELWICDNNSPVDNMEWLINYPSINVIVNRNNYGLGGSYENAVAIELVRSQLPTNTKYLMTLHQDIAVIKSGWLTYLISKIKGNIVAAGVREDTGRVKDGILHVLGYVVDLSKVIELKLNYFPQLPHFDTGDKLISELKKNGYSYWASSNTLWEPNLVNTIPNISPIKDLNVDRSFDDDGDVFFLHLGRGVEKTKQHRQNEKVKQWITVLRNHYLNSASNVNIGVESVADINYSIRRYYTDLFLNYACLVVASSSSVIDIGGKKENKRGKFNIENYFSDVIYLNIDSTTNPDYLASLYSIPVNTESYDAFFLTEVLEHLSDPIQALNEAYRVVKKNGYGIITTPFMFHIHGDPEDYFRPSIQWFKKNLTDLGFEIVSIQQHGGFWAVIVNEIRFYIRYLINKSPKSIKYKCIIYCLTAIVNWLIRNKYLDKYYNNSILDGHTTGYGIIVRKK